MVLTRSLMAQLGSPAPDFNLRDVVSGATLPRDAARGPRGLLVMFICRHPDQKPSLGCNIKWKPGHEPASTRG